jgi:hypothetical protein
VHTNLDPRERGAVRLGVAAAVLALLTLAGVQAAAIRPYLPPDELYHVGYAATVLNGRLPTLTTPVPAERVPLMPTDGQPRRVYVANHPPLFYVLAAVPIWVGERLAAPRAGFLAARLVSVCLTAGGLVMVAWLALLLVPGRPRAASSGVLLHGRGRPLRRVPLAAGAGVLVGGVAGGSAIWFYLRNRSLYGSLTGAAYNQQLFGFVPQDHVAQLLGSPGYLLRLYDGLWVWTRFSLSQVRTLPVLVAAPRVLALAAIAGLFLAAARGLRGRWVAGPDLPAVVAWTLALGWGVAVYVMVASYDGHGGHTHPRYLFPGVAVLAVVGSLGMDRLPGARRGFWIGTATLAQLVLTGMAWAAFVTALRGRRPASPADLAGGCGRAAGGRRGGLAVAGPGNCRCPADRRPGPARVRPDPAGRPALGRVAG